MLGQVDSNNVQDVFLYDRVLGTTKLVSHSVAGPATAGNGMPEYPVISGNGKFVAFTSNATNLVSAQPDGNIFGLNVYLYDVDLGTTLLVSRNSYLLRVGDVILILNVFIFLAAAFFLGVESAMYSILTYVAASKTVDFLLHGVEEYTAITIISARSDEIKLAIMGRLNRGVTIFSGHGGMGSTGVTEQQQQILYCVVTRLEIGSVKSLVSEIDPHAFTTTHTLSDVQGGLLKRPVLH